MPDPSPWLNSGVLGVLLAVLVGGGWVAYRLGERLVTGVLKAVETITERALKTCDSIESGFRGLGDFDQRSALEAAARHAETRDCITTAETNLRHWMASQFGAVRMLVLETALADKTQTERLLADAKAQLQVQVTQPLPSREGR